MAMLNCLASLSHVKSRSIIYGISTNTAVKRRTKGKTIRTTGYATAHDTIHAASHLIQNPLIKPTLINILINDTMPLIKQDKNNGIIHAANFAGSFGILPTIVGGVFDISLSKFTNRTHFIPLMNLKQLILPRNLNHIYKE